MKAIVSASSNTIVLYQIRNLNAHLKFYNFLFKDLQFMNIFGIHKFVFNKIFIKNINGYYF